LDGVIYVYRCYIYIYTRVYIICSLDGRLEHAQKFQTFILVDHFPNILTSVGFTYIQKTERYIIYYVRFLFISITFFLSRSVRRVFFLLHSRLHRVSLSPFATRHCHLAQRKCGPLFIYLGKHAIRHSRRVFRSIFRSCFLLFTFVRTTRGKIGKRPFSR